jgi:hypothetical protein
LCRRLCRVIHDIVGRPDQIVNPSCLAASTGLTSRINQDFLTFFLLLTKQSYK